MDIMPRAGMVSPPPATGGGGGETRPDTGQLIDPPSMTFGFPFVPLRDCPVPYNLAASIDDDSLFSAAGAFARWPAPEDG
jgi:hypothetical protein